MKSFKRFIKEQIVATSPPAPPAIVRPMQGPTSTQKALKRVIPREVVPALEPTRLVEKLKPHLQGLGEHAALVALDASVNHGNNFAKKLIEKHGDDAKGMLESRRRECDRLAFANPDKYISYHNGWMNRLKYFKDRLQ